MMKYSNHLLFGQLPIQSNVINIVILLVRFFAGVTIMGAGLDKLPLTDWMVDQVAEIGFPFPVAFAWIASFTEFAAGLLLILGFHTRIASALLAFVMAVAAFGHHSITPIFEMHIAHTYVWLYVLLAAIGGGKFSLDYLAFHPIQNNRSKFSWLSIPILTLLVGYGAFTEITAPDIESVEEEEPKIETLSVPGSFNNWDLKANLMTTKDQINYEAIIEVTTTGPIEFKIAANESWDINWGELDQEQMGFPISGIAEINDSGDSQNIKGYIPNPGKYKLELELVNFSYSLISVEDKPES